jgi:hypothetical protein
MRLWKAGHARRVDACGETVLEPNSERQHSVVGERDEYIGIYHGGEYIHYMRGEQGLDLLCRLGH